MKRKIASLTGTPVEQFVAALHAGDVESVRTLLEEHAEVRAAVNAPVSWFDSRPVARATKNLPLLDVLLAHGADLNLKSEWWAGGFGILETDLTPEQARPLIERGARIDVFAAAHLGMFDRLRELIDGDPSLVHARGGDGKTPLHCARTVEIAEYLLARGAEIDARDVDHESTAAQYLVRDAPDVTRLLVQRGAWFDIFIAVGLRDAALLERCLSDDPEALDHRTWHGKYRVTTMAGVLRRPTRSATTAATFIAGYSTTTSPPWMSRCTTATTRWWSGCCSAPRRRNACWQPALQPIVPEPRRSSPLIPTWWRD